MWKTTVSKADWKIRKNFYNLQWIFVTMATKYLINDRHV